MDRTSRGIVGPVKSRVLVIEDDARIAASVALYLRHAGFDVDVATTGPDGLEQASDRRPDLVVLDLMLPGIDGLSVCEALQHDRAVPVIMLTARATEADKLRGLESGADDYVTKPFSPRELVARVRAVLRRAAPGARVVRAGDVEIDLLLRRVRRGGRTVAVTASEFRLLEVLASTPGRAFTRTELAERAFGHEYEGLERTIDVHVKNLRKKLDARTGPRAHVIATVFGTGYRLETAPGAD